MNERGVIMEKKVEISILLEIYGKLLTEKQYEFINDYPSVKEYVNTFKSKIDSYSKELKVVSSNVPPIF